MLLTQAHLLASEPIQRADIDRYLGLIEMNDGIPADACQLLLRAAAEVAPLDGERALQLLFLASVAATWADDGEAAVAIAQLAQGLAVDYPDPPYACCPSVRARRPLSRATSPLPRRHFAWP